MKRLSNMKIEKGAITVMTALMMTVLLGFTALGIDIGLHHYLGAKLQNAVDAAATAVGQRLDADEIELDRCAYEYLAKNGFDKEENDSIIVDIDFKGVVNQEILNSVNEDEEYISKGYVKLTVDIDDSTLFAKVLGIDSLHLHKTSYVLVEPNYEGMPEALKYSIFAGASMGDKVPVYDGNDRVKVKDDYGNVVKDENGEDKIVTQEINAENPAMDIQGSTGAGSGETAFSTIVGVTENAVNGINNFVQNLKGWMNKTFKTSFETDYNKLTNINVSEAIMNNDAHSNSNILIGVQALNVSRTKDNDYTGDNPQNDNTSNYAQYEYAQEGDDDYYGKTDAEDYGQVTFTAVDNIDFGYSQYAKKKQTNFFDEFLLNQLKNNKDWTRVYVQNQQAVQAVQHTVNIINEMDLGASTEGSFSNSYNSNDGDFELAAKRYFAENNAVSDAIKNKVYQMEPDLSLTIKETEGKDKYEITLNSQEAIVYRVNQEQADNYLDQYASITVTETELEKQRLSRLAKLTLDFATTGYDRMYKENNPANGFMYQGYADKDGSEGSEPNTTIGHDDVVFERYENAQGESVDKDAEGASLKYTATLTVKGHKVNRNTDNVEEYYSEINNPDAVAQTRLGSKYAIVRTFREKSDYIDMPNLKPYFTRQINQSIRDATKKREQHNDGVTTGDRNIKEAVATAQNDLREVVDEVEYNDNTYKTTSKYDNEYAQGLLFQSFKANANSGLTKLTDEEQTLGGAAMSKTTYKGFELYEDKNGTQTLRNALSFVNQYDNRNHDNKWFGHYAVNAVATGMKFQGKDDTQEMNAVAEKKAEINKQYGDDYETGDGSKGGIDSYARKKNQVENSIASIAPPNIEDVTGIEGEAPAKTQILGTPVDPLNINGNKVFLGDSGEVRTTFNTTLRQAIEGTNESPAPAPATITDSDVSLPSLVSGYSHTEPTAATDVSSANYDGETADSKFALQPVPTNTSGYSEGNKSYTGGDIDKGNNTKYWYTTKNESLGTSVTLKSGTVLFTNNIVITGGGKSVNNANATLYVNGNVEIKTNKTGHIDWRSGTHSYIAGYVNMANTARGTKTNEDQNQVSSNAVVEVGKWYYHNQDFQLESGAKLTIGGAAKKSLTISGEGTYNCGMQVDGSLVLEEGTANNPTTLRINGDYASNTSGTDVTINNNTIMVVKGNLKVRRHLTVASGGKLYVTGNIEAWNNISNSGTIVCGGSITSYDGTLTNSGQLTSSNSVTISKTITNNSGATLRVNNNITANNQSSNVGITNSGTMECGGTLKAFTGDLKNYSTINAGYIRVGDNTERWMFNDGTINVVNDIYVNGRYHNNNDKKNINASITVGGDFTAVGDLYNFPGNSSTTAVIRVKGNFSAGSITNNRNDSTSKGTAYIYVGGDIGASNSKIAVTNYEPTQIYGGTGTFYLATVENAANCKIKNNGSIVCSPSLTNNGEITAGIDFTGSTINNSGTIYAGRDFTINNSLASANHDIGAGRNLHVSNNNGSVTVTGFTLKVGGSITGTGAINCTNITAKTSITANSLYMAGVVKTNGNITVSGAVSVGNSASLYAGNATTQSSISGGTITNNNTVTATGNISTTSGALTNNKHIYCYGSISTSGDLLQPEQSGRSHYIKCRGNITVGGQIENYGTLYVGTFDTANNTWNSETGSITVNGYYTSGDYKYSVRNYENIYMAGNLTMVASFYGYGACDGDKGVYVFGDVIACNNNIEKKNLVELKKECKFYVHGCVTSDGNTADKRIWLRGETQDDATANCPKTVFSVFGAGRGNADCFKNKLEAFINTQKGSNVYINSDMNMSGTGNSNAAYTDFKNDGRLYVYGAINCPNMLSARLRGNYDYYPDKTDAQKREAAYVSGTYSDDTPVYSGLTYCLVSFNAPNMVLNFSESHYLYVKDTPIPNYNQYIKTYPAKVNVNVARIIMDGSSMFFAPNQVDVTGTVDLSGSAIFNVVNKVNAAGTTVADGSTAQLEAPIVAKVTGDDNVLTGLSNVVFNRDMTDISSITGTRVEIRINGNLQVNGKIKLTNSRLIVTGTISCGSMELNNSKVRSESNLTIATGDVGGSLEMTNNSQLLTGKTKMVGNVVSLDGDANINRVGTISINHSTLFVAGSVYHATSATLADHADFISRDRINSHNTLVALEGYDDVDNTKDIAPDVSVTGHSRFYVDGQLNAGNVTVNDKSELLTQLGIVFPSNSSVAINVDTTTHSSEGNSFVFNGKPNSNDDVTFDLEVAGTLYMPPNKNYGKDGKLMKVYVKDTGIAVVDSNITSNWVQVGDSSDANGVATLYCAGRITLAKDSNNVGSCYTNYGRLYAYDGTDIANWYGNAGQNVCDTHYTINSNLVGLMDNSETFFGKLYSGNSSALTAWNFKGYYEGHGDTYIDAGLNIGNNCSNTKVDDRYTSLYVPNGTTYVSGNVTLPDGNAILTEKGAGFVAQKDLTMGCAIWNFGKLHIYGSFTMNQNHQYPTSKGEWDADKVYKEGWSILNGKESDEGKIIDNPSFVRASFIAYNSGNKGGTIMMKGRVMNYGEIYMNYGLDVRGFMKDNYTYKPDGGESLGRGDRDYAFVNYVGSIAHFGGLFRCNTNLFMNKWDATFGCDGKLTYGKCAYNCGKMYVGGDLTNDEITSDDQRVKDGLIEADTFRGGGEYRDNRIMYSLPASDSFGFSFMNGLMGLGDYTSDNKNKNILGRKLIFENAELFVGGQFKVGSQESVADSGSIINVGTMRVRKDLLIYGDGGQAGRHPKLFGSDTGTVYFQTALWCPTNSNTFVGGRVVAGGAVATGKNTIFMCGGDFRARKAVKLNMWFKYYDQGGTAGNVISYFEDESWVEKRYGSIDAYRSCYMRIGGNMYCNVEGRDLHSGWFSNLSGEDVPFDNSRDMDIQANSNIYIDGSFYCPQKLYLKQNVTLIVANALGADKAIVDSDGNLDWQCRALYDDSSNGDKNDPTKYETSITSRIQDFLEDLVDTLVRRKDEFHITKQYVMIAYQSLDVGICSHIVVNGDTMVKDTCKIRDMTKTYFYGDFDANDYVEIGKALNNMEYDEDKKRWKETESEDATAAKKSQYRESDKELEDYVFSNAGYMYVEGDMESARYTKVYASTTLKVGGNMNTQSVINGYLTLRHDARLFVGGNLKAQTSIDCGAYSELYVGGNMTAYQSNIKLRDQMTVYVGGNLTAATYIELGKYDDNFYRGIKNERVQAYLTAAGDPHKDDRDEEQGNVTGGTEYGYNSNNNQESDSEASGEAGNDNNAETENTTTDNQQFVKEESELANDSSDLAVGSEIYIGGNLISFTKYIREYAYTRVVSGGYVLSTQHITLRHNSDLWVLPEVFEYYVCSSCKAERYKKWTGACPSCGAENTCCEYCCSKSDCNYISTTSWTGACPDCGSTGTCTRIKKQTYHSTEFVYQPGWDASLWSTLKTYISKVTHDIKEDFTTKEGSVYALGQMSMNKNTSIFGTYDTMVFGQTVMRKGALVFMGHDFDCYAPTYNLQTSLDVEEGASASEKFNAFMDTVKSNLGLSENKTYKGFDSYDSSQNKSKPIPIVIYANNEINVSTTARIRSTYFVANRGNVNFTNLNFASETSEVTLSDAKGLPNAFASYQKDVNFYAMRGTLGALMYAPQGRINLDGFAYNFYGSMVGDTVSINTFYINVHRFNNWRTMDLHIATSKKVYLIPKKDYENAQNNVDDVYMYGYDKNPDTNLNEWAQPFFYGLKKDSATTVDGSGDGDGSGT